MVRAWREKQALSAGGPYLPQRLAAGPKHTTQGRFLATRFDGEAFPLAGDAVADASSFDSVEAAGCGEVGGCSSFFSASVSPVGLAVPSLDRLS